MVSLAGESELTLPVDSTHLFSSTWPIPRHPEMVEYRWEKVGGPNKGALSGTDRKDLEMTGVSGRGGGRGRGVVEGVGEGEGVVEGVGVRRGRGWKEWG